MDSLISSYSLEEEGKRVYNTNPFFHDLGEFMEHPLCRSFYNKYFSSSGCESSLFFLWLYAEVDEKCVRMSPYEKLGLIKTLVSNSDTRAEIMDMYDRIRPKMISFKGCLEERKETTPKLKNGI
jgi:hypothetical protein